MRALARIRQSDWVDRIAWLPLALALAAAAGLVGMLVV